MNIIFLDMDGVMNRASTITRGRIGNIGIDPVLMDRFKLLLKQVDAEVVISSAWRKFPELLEEIREHITVKDVTPVINDATRGQEIDAWLRAHEEEWERYAIIDDDRDMLPGQDTFFCDSREGLTPFLMQLVVIHLNGRGR